MCLIYDVTHSFQVQREYDSVVYHNTQGMNLAEKLDNQEMMSNAFKMKNFVEKTGEPSGRKAGQECGRRLVFHCHRHGMMMNSNALGVAHKG